MGAFERAVWAVLYVAAGVGILIVAYAASDALRLHAGPIPAFVIATIWLSAWRTWRQRIVRALGWGTRIAIVHVRTVVNRVLWRALLWKYPPKLVGAIRTFVMADSEEQRTERRRRLGVAIALIERHSPARYQRLVRLAPVVVVGVVRSGGAFFMGTNVIAVNEHIVDNWQPESVAAVICHELAHYYVEVLGIPWTPWTETRSERLAHGETLRWARRLVAENVLTPQSHAELKVILRLNLDRWWWRNDGSRVHGSEFARTSQTTAPDSPTSAQNHEANSEASA